MLYYHRYLPYLQHVSLNCFDAPGRRDAYEEYRRGAPCHHSGGELYSHRHCLLAMSFFRAFAHSLSISRLAAAHSIYHLRNNLVMPVYRHGRRSGGSAPLQGSGYVRERRYPQSYYLFTITSSSRGKLSIIHSVLHSWYSQRTRFLRRLHVSAIFLADEESCGMRCSGVRTYLNCGLGAPETIWSVG